ncbi:MAG: MFS transporter [Bacteroidetes bacterium RBG_13_43_22]|nr:MAG: MFS transporter [Bacteroidetes bacterium RBG_13_43_22]
MRITEIISGNDTANRRTQIYVVITAFCSLLAIVGFALYGLPFFYDFYMKEFGWSRTVVTSGNALGKLLVAPLFGFFAGWIIDRYGPRRMMMAGALMTGAALIGLSSMKSLDIFYVSYIFVALGYVFGGPLPCQVLISRSFTKNRGKAMGIAYLGIGSGFALVPLIAAGLEKHFGWHFSLASLGIIIIIIALPLVFFLKDTKPEPVAATGSGETAPVRNILKSPWFYLLAFGSMCSIAAVGGVNQHFKLYLRELDFTQTQAARMISLVAIMSLAGRVLMGWLADIFQRKYVMILIYLLVGLSIPLLLLPEFPGRLYIFAVIFGIGLGGDYMIIPLMAGDLFGVKTLGRVMGIILVADGIAEASMPMAVGAMRDAAPDYATGFVVLICIAFTGALIISFLPKQKRGSGGD